MWTLVNQWLCGGSHQYVPLSSRMNGDEFWIYFWIAINSITLVGKFTIAYTWDKNQKIVRSPTAKKALSTLMLIFILSAIDGSLMNIVRLYWPGFRFMVLMIVPLAYFTWRFVFMTSGIRFIMESIAESEAREQKILAAENAVVELKADGKRKIQFLNAVSHDLRTPLNALVLECANAVWSMKDNDKASTEEALENIQKSAQTVVHMLDRFLELGKIDYTEDVNRMAVVNMKELVVRMTASFKAEASKKGIGLIFGGDFDMELVTDIDKLERVLMNLISNAIKFTETGYVSLKILQDDDTVHLAVKDTGVGIPSGDHERLFAEFYQGHNNERSKKKGFGLGLCISRRLTRQIGGDLLLRESGPSGSEFRVCLPKRSISDSGATTFEEPSIGQVEAHITC